MSRCSLFYHIFSDNLAPTLELLDAARIEACVGHIARVGIEVQTLTQGSLSLSAVTIFPGGGNASQPLTVTEIKNTRPYTFNAFYTWLPKVGERLEVVAEDARGVLGALIPAVVLCYCHHGGQCDYSHLQV